MLWVSGEVGRDDRLAGVVAVQARTLVALQLHHFQVVGAFGGRGDEVQDAALVG